MITCRELVPALRAVLERDLPGEELSSLEAHLAECLPCKTVARTYEALRALAGDLALAGPPPGMRERLREALLSRPPQPPAAPESGESLPEPGEPLNRRG